MRCLQHCRDPFALGVQRGAPRTGGLLRIHNVTQARGMFLASRIPPAGLAGVREENNGAHDAVGKRIAIAIGMVRARDLVSLPVVYILNKGNGRVIGTKRRTRQRQAMVNVIVGLLDTITPALGITGVVNLIQDHQSAPGRGHRAVLEGVHSYLRIGHHNAIHRGIDSRRIAKRRIQR